MSGHFYGLGTLTRGKYPPVPTGQDPEWASDAVWTLWKKQISCPCREQNPEFPIVQPEAYID
jgi:hypothetical protein